MTHAWRSLNTWISSTQAAQRLGIKPKTLAKWRMEGRGPVYHKMSSRFVRYAADEVDRWIQEQASNVPREEIVTEKQPRDPYD